MRTKTEIRVENEINAAVRKLYAEGITPQEMKAAIDRIVADITAEATRRVYAQMRKS